MTAERYDYYQSQQREEDISMKHTHGGEDNATD